MLYVHVCILLSVLENCSLMLEVLEIICMNVCVPISPSFLSTLATVLGLVKAA